MGGEIVRPLPRSVRGAPSSEKKKLDMLSAAAPPRPPRMATAAQWRPLVPRGSKPAAAVVSFAKNLRELLRGHGAPPVQPWLRLLPSSVRKLWDRSTLDRLRQALSEASQDDRFKLWEGVLQLSGAIQLPSEWRPDISLHDSSLDVLCVDLWKAMKPLPTAQMDVYLYRIVYSFLKNKLGRPPKSSEVIDATRAWRRAAAARGPRAQEAHRAQKPLTKIEAAVAAALWGLILLLFLFFKKLLWDDTTEFHEQEAALRELRRFQNQLRFSDALLRPTEPTVAGNDCDRGCAPKTWEDIFTGEEPDSRGCCLNKQCYDYANLLNYIESSPNKVLPHTGRSIDAAWLRANCRGTAGGWWGAAAAALVQGAARPGRRGGSAAPPP